MIEQYRRKPDKPSTQLMHAVKFDPDQPLDELRRVAAKATMSTHRSKSPQLVVAAFDDGPVLIVRYLRRPHDEGQVECEWVHVKAGDYLAYYEQYGTLGDLDDAEIAQWYVRADR